MKIIIGCQTEGAGHCSQAIAVKEFLDRRDADYEIPVAFAAKKDKGIFPDFARVFKVDKYEGFDFVFEQGSLSVTKTFFKNTFKLHKIVKSFIHICKIIKKEKPDVIFNFYDPLVGLSSLFFKDVKYIHFGHQYAMENDPDYPDVFGFLLQKLTLKILNKISAPKGNIVALSFSPAEDKGRVFFCPPILRDDIYKKEPSNDKSILVYLMNDFQLNYLIKEAKKHPKLQFNCFIKRPENHKVDLKNVKLYPVGKDFKKFLITCDTVICTGGFETSSEAMYLGKRLLMVPVYNHYEQHANCLDAQFRCGASYHSHIKLNKTSLPEADKNWFDKADEVLVKAILHEDK